jgi:spore coat polysaccharide biosynthesis protein SpsF (cytidylyltransferase family)
MDKTILEYVMERVVKARKVDELVVATTESKVDAEIGSLVKMRGGNVFCGSEQDVLDRFYKAASLFKAENIVRITADCPLIDPKIVDGVISHYFKTGADYCSNVIEETFPDGQDVEVFSFQALESAWADARLLSEREHVTPYLRNNPDKFKIVSFKNAIDLHDKRWTLDRSEDFSFIKRVLEGLYPEDPDFGMEEIIGFLKKNPGLEDINKDIKRNEGYLKSLKSDKRLV